MEQFFALFNDHRCHEPVHHKRALPGSSVLCTHADVWSAGLTNECACDWSTVLPRRSARMRNKSPIISRE